MMKKIFCAALAVIMVLGMAACGKTETPAPTVPTYVDGVAVENGTEIIDNVPMVKGSVVGAEKEYLTIAEVEALGYTVSYKDDQMTISKVQDIEGNLNNDVNVEDPNASTDVIGGNETENNGDETTENPGDVTVEDPNGSENVPNEGDNDTNTEKPVEHVHSYTSKVVAPTTEEQGYTVHTCDCGDSYKDNYTDKVEKPAPEHKHAYKDTVVAPTCENGGYTVHTCDCGHSYSDKETKATGHSYTEKVVAPTTSAKGYTLHTCSKCGTSYKDSYVDKLPTQTTTPSNPGNTGDTGYEEGGWKGDDYGSGEKIEGNEQIAGQFVDHKGYSRKFYTDGMTAADARTALNSYVGYVYGRRFFSDGISINDADTGKFAKIVTHEDGRLGVNVFGWRNSYDSDVVQNSCINMVMEAFYFMCGDKDVAYALFNIMDYMNINKTSISNDKLESMGFVIGEETANSIVISKNGVEIFWTWSGPSGAAQDTFYFQ